MLFLSPAFHIPQVCIISKAKQLNLYLGETVRDSMKAVADSTQEMANAAQGNALGCE